MKIKEEKGAISVLVIVTMLFIVAILTSMYMSAANRYSTQMEVSKQIKEVYEKDLGQIADVYETYQAEGLYIYTKADLEKFRDRVNSGINFEGKTVYLMNDIDLNEGNYIINEDGTVTFLDGAEQWTPIGNEENTFNGTFDGKGYIIKGIYINNDTLDYQGLFGINIGTINNLYIENSYINGNNNIGGIIGKSSGEIKNCNNKATIIGKKQSTGGIVGYNYGTIQDCINEGIVTGNRYVGGIAGYNKQSISNCNNRSKVLVALQGDYSTEATTDIFGYVGGVIGYNEGNVEQCYNNGEIAVNVGENTNCNAYFGGIAGINDNGASVNCSYNAGIIQGGSTRDTVAGGIVGGNYNSSIVQNCYNIQKVSAYSTMDQWNSYVGGISGINRGEIKNVYNIGPVEATGNKINKGGITSATQGDLASVSNSYYMDTCNAQGDGQSYTNEQMKLIYNLLGSSWMQDTNNTNNGYPILRDNIIYITDYRLIDKPEWIGDITSDSNYYWFELDGTSLRPTNSLKNLGEDSWAKSYFTIDLSNYSTTDTLQIIFNAEISSELGYDYGYIAINDSKVDINSYSTDEYYNEEDDVYYDYISGLKTSDGNDITQFIANSGDVERKNYKTTLLGGKKYYIYLGYIKNSSVDYGKDAIIVNDITLTKL